MSFNILRLIKMFCFSFTLASISTIIFVNFCFADVYKYIDEDGRTHLTNDITSKLKNNKEWKLIAEGTPRSTTPQIKKSDVAMHGSKNDETKSEIAETSKKNYSLLEEILFTKNLLIDKQEEGKLIITHFNEKINLLISEIKNINKMDQINSFNKIIKNNKVKQNMVLIQKLTAYIEKIKELNEKFETGIEELVYIERDIQLSSKVENLFDNIDLVKKIDIALNDYGHYKNNFVIDEKKLKFAPLEKIYTELITKKFTVEDGKVTGEK